MDYATLTAPKATPGSIANWVNYTLLDTQSVVEDAQAFIISRLRVREMQWTASLTLAQGATSVAVPADYLDPKALVLASGDEVRLTDDRSLLRNRLVDEAGTILPSIPSRYAVFNDVINFDCANDQARTATLLYYRRPALLSLSNPTNFLTARYPHMLRAACIQKAWEFREDASRSDSWLTKTVAYIDAANAEADLSLRGADFAVESR